jgi:tRNA A37 threonylcarbamoyladenosine biosynthesis protein TsaE
MAFAALKYGVQSGAGFSVISSEIGCGKTTLVRHLLNRIGPDITVGLTSNTHPDIVNLHQ